MKTIQTRIGLTYVVTMTQAGAVHGITASGASVQLASIDQPGQVAFQAVSAETTVSDDDAIVNPTKAPAVCFGGGGLDAVQVAEMIASSEGSVNVLYDSVTQSPPEGNLDNYDAYGWAMVVTEPGRLETVTLQSRSEGTVQDPFPVYLNIWVEDGNAWRLLGASENGVEQVLGEAFVWTFSGVELVAGQKLHVEAHRQKGSEARDARLSVRVVANSLADTGMIERNGEVRVVDWVPQYSLALSRPVGLTARGVALAEDADLTAHAQDAVRHVTAAERESWNAKANASALAGKVNTATFTAHANDAVKHVTAAERDTWNHKANTTDMGNLANDLNGHIDDSVKHVTAEERGRWNAATGGVTRAEMEAYVAEYVAAHAPAVDLSDYQGAIHLRDEAGNEVLRTIPSGESGMPCLYLGSERMMVGLGGNTHVVISGTLDVPVYGISAGYVSAGYMMVDTNYLFNNGNSTATAISYVDNAVRIMHSGSYVDVDATGVLLSVNGGLSKINVGDSDTTIKNSRVVISSSECILKDGAGNACPPGDLRVDDGGLIISQP